MIAVVLICVLVVTAITLGNVIGWASTGPHTWRWQVLLGPWMYERALAQPAKIKASRRIWGVLVKIRGAEGGAK